MATRDSLGDRMKSYYEDRAKTYLTKRTPVIIRLDGRAFHSFMRNFQRPYDEVFHKAMNQTLKYLCENIQGCKFGYTQSDEITLVLTDYDNLTTDGWFDYAVQKMCSISASMATLAFNRYFGRAVGDYCASIKRLPNGDLDGDMLKQYNIYNAAITRGAMFDSRCFNLPKEEVCNCLIWRQQDATRNAIQMLGQTYFSHKQLNEKSCADIQDMLFLEKGINFNDMPAEFKRGTCCYRKDVECADRPTGYKNVWFIDTDCPIFTQDREYVEKWI